MNISLYIILVENTSFKYGTSGIKKFTLAPVVELIPAFITEDSGIFDSPVTDLLYNGKNPLDKPVSPFSS